MHGRVAVGFILRGKEDIFLFVVIKGTKRLIKGFTLDKP